VNYKSFLARAKLVLYSALIGVVAGYLVVKSMKLCNILSSQHFFRFLGHYSIYQQKVAFVCFFLTALTMGTIAAVLMKPPRE